MDQVAKEFFGILSAFIVLAGIIGLVVYHSGTTADISAGSQAFNSALSTATFQGNGSSLGGLGAAASSMSLTGFGG